MSVGDVDASYALTQLSYEELDRFCEPRLGFRRPRSLVLLDALPYTAYGKVDRKQLVAAPAEEPR